VPYFKAGLTNNEYCLWITSKDLPVSHARNAIRKSLLKSDEIGLGSKMEIFSQSNWYLKHRRLDAEGVRKAWMKKMSHALEQGCEGIRVCGVIPWLSSKQLQDFEQYEKKIDKLFAQKRILTLCAYSTQNYTIEQLMKALRHHRFVLIQIGDNCELIELSHRQPVLPSSEDYELLTTREQQVMHRISEGLTNAEIASSLAISVRTVEVHRSNLMRKLRLRNQADLIRFALIAEMAPQDREKTG
jgi:DNA-binding CsgD family transcriptional regulator